MVDNHSLGLIINVILHVLILFIFLTGLFFTIIAKKEVHEVNSQLQHVIDSGIDEVLDKITFLHVKDWQWVQEVASNGKNTNKDPSAKVEENNNSLLYNCSIIIIMLIGIMTFFIVYVVGIHHRKIGLRYILSENLLIFLILGGLEFGFFWYIVQNYVPLYPDDAEIAVLERLKSYFM